MYESVLVATDGSAAAALAGEHAIELATRYGADLHAVSVVETRTGYDAGVVDPDEVDDLLRSRGRRALEDLESLAAADLPVRTELRTGVPHEEILATVEERGADLVVVGATGRSSFKRALLGSTVDALVRFAPVPVLVVGDGERDQA